MNNKTLGTIAAFGAPTMLIGSYLEQVIPQLANSWFTGVWGLLYITPWMCSIRALQRSGAFGNSRVGKAMPWVLFVTLTLANISNLMWVLAARDLPFSFFYIDLFWPISHVLMLPMGIIAIRAKKLEGWKRYVPLAMGTWLPVALGTLALLGRNDTAFLLGGLYNTIVVLLLALVARSAAGHPAQRQPNTLGFQPVLP